MPIFSPSLVSKFGFNASAWSLISSFVAFKQADDEFSLINANVAMVIKGGRIVSLKDVSQKWVIPCLTDTSTDSRSS